MTRQRLSAHMLAAFAISIASCPLSAAVLLSDGTDYAPEPTHCAFYLDGSPTSVRLPVGHDDADMPRCGCLFHGIRRRIFSSPGNFSLLKRLTAKRDRALRASRRVLEPDAAKL